MIWSLERASGADALVGAGMLLAPLLVPLLILLVIGLPGLRGISRRLTALLLVACTVVAVAGVARALVYEPILDLRCGLFCGHSPVLVVANLGLAAWLGAVVAATTAIVCGIIALEILFSGPARASGGVSRRAVARAGCVGDGCVQRDSSGYAPL